MNTSRLCPECGTALPTDAPEGLCPQCLAKSGLATEQPPSGTLVVGPQATRARELPKPGQQFGGYRIVRQLGCGGMGAVYDAEHLESGRRVALKVLSHQLDSPEAHKRFLREGRLAASINHPNSVYIYGTEEIEGTPAIAMELIAGGTLQERVQRSGPLPVAEAVDAILQVIAGLEAAQAKGILHRDIKPANCFQDADGMVKIGDFGLSISTAARGDTHLTLQGQFLGTPAFCSPEQLRGEELNVRSDMYSVGVTLFYLLTGRTPFEGKDFVQLLANVLEKPAPSPRIFEAKLPVALAKIVLRCLEKQAGERFKNYAELRQALAPFGAAAPIPATLGRRFLAGVVDHLILSIIGGLLSMGALLTTQGGFVSMFDPAAFRSPRMLALWTSAVVLSLLYYSLLEGLWGATAGKALCGVRVTGPERNLPGVPRAMLRAFLYAIVPMLPAWFSVRFDPTRFMDPSHSLLGAGIGLVQFVIVGLLFTTMRRRNGFAALHDLITGTRVIRTPSYQARPTLALGEEAPVAAETKPMVGPYHILETLEKAGDGEWLVGYDMLLLRKVWIRTVPVGAAPVAPALRNLGRVGRLRWITGRRSAQENWDAFEGVTGKPLVNLLAQPQPWSQVRYWLLDLATEIAAAEKDGTLPAILALDRVWITGDGRAKLLDFRAPGAVSPTDASLSQVGPQFVMPRAVPSPVQAGGPGSLAPPPLPEAMGGTGGFLNQVAIAALETRLVDPAEPGSGVPTRPLPLHARTFLEKLPTLPSADAVAGALKPLMQNLAVVSRLRRAALVAACLAFPLLGTAGFTVASRVMANWQRGHMDRKELAQVLNQRMVVRSPWWPKSQPLPDDRAFGIYLASHYRAAITNPASWKSPFVMFSVPPQNRLFAEQSVTNYPNPTTNEIAEAETAMKPILSMVQASAAMEGFYQKPWFIAFIFGSLLYIYVCFPALFSALVFRGGLVQLVGGVKLVARDGRPASRLRVFWRSLVAWSPMVFVPILLALLIPLQAALTARNGNPAAATNSPVRMEVAEELVKTNASQATNAALVSTNSAFATNASAFPGQDFTGEFSQAVSGAVLGSGSVVALLVLGLTVWSLALRERGLQDRLAGTWPVPR
jgi:eukaryotic-like serine/threonine-protein kinase